MTIDEMPAGRELDRLIAEKVMDLPGVGYYKRESCQTTRWVPCAADSVTEDCPEWKADLYYVPGAENLGPKVALAMSWGPRAIPRYSADIAAAWKVVEKLDVRNTSARVLGLASVTLTRYNGGVWRCRFTRGSAITAWANTAPLAICRAALKTIGDNQ